MTVLDTGRAALPPPTAPSVPFVQGLDAYGDRVAVRGPSGPVTYADLAGRAAAVADRLGTTRRLVLLEAANTLDSLVGYLGALHAGHPVLLAPADRPAEVDALVAAYDPDVVLGDRRLQERRPGTAHALHPDLALLLSTSGTTGSPKLVRLSHANLQANAEAVADSLGIRDTDRAATTLPLSYCYGLSVVHSHLLRGAGLILTELSVVDPCFRELMREHRGTCFAGVPYTFELLDRVGPDLRLPDLRYVTQAGGRMAPEQVRRYAELGRRAGWDLFVMYGQTEATARMACLPPELALSHPTALGGTLPDGSLALEPFEGAEAGTGELVYRGPNVMLGYAHGPGDLALGATVDALRTGDVARQVGPDLYEIVGRRHRTAKVFGLRLDLAHLERRLAAHDVPACCAATEDELVVAVLEQCPAGDDEVRRAAARCSGLPAGAVRVLRLGELPRRPSGKPDLPALVELARRAPARGAPAADVSGVVALYAAALDRDDVTPADSFVGLGGDSLSYVEVSLRLEELLGHLPTAWHTTPIGALVPLRGRRTAPVVETSVALRALAVLLVVVSHADLVEMAGGAHVLLAVVGFNAARFAGGGADRRARVGALLRGAGRIAVPAVLWIAGVLVLTDRYVPANLVLLNSVLGPEQLSRPWEMWFVETVVYTLLAVAALLALPAVDRLERRAPYAVALGLVGAGLVARYGLVGDTGPDRVFTAPVVFWLVALGWAGARAGTARRRLVLSAVAVAALPGFFGDPLREALVAGGVLLLLWVPTLPCPRVVGRVAGLLATCSLGIYLTHWVLLDPLAGAPVLAVVASVALGVAYWQAVTRLPRLVRSARRPAAGVLQDDGHRTSEEATWPTRQLQDR